MFTRWESLLLGGTQSAGKNSKVEGDRMQSELPKKLHEYTNHVILDSTRWRVYNHRPGDIVIST